MAYVVVGIVLFCVAIAILGMVAGTVFWFVVNFWWAILIAAALAIAAFVYSKKQKAVANRV